MEIIADARSLLDVRSNGFVLINCVIKVFGIVVIIFFGGSIVLLRQVLNREPRLIIDENGVTDSTIGNGKIEWDDIISGRFVSIFGTPFIVLKLLNTDKYLERLSSNSRRLAKVNKELGFGEINLNLSLIDMSPRKVFQLLKENISKDTNEH